MPERRASPVGPDAEPLLATVLLEALDPDKPELDGEAHGALVSDLCAQHDRLAGKSAGKPVECCPAGLEGVPLPPVLWEEHVAELDLAGLGSNVTGPAGVAPVEGDYADQRTAEIDREVPGALASTSGT